MLLCNEMKGRLFLYICIFLSIFTLCTCKAAPEKSAAADNAPVESEATPAPQTAARQTANGTAVYSAQEHQEQAGRIEVAYEILEEGSYGAQFGTAVIENQADLDRLYALLHGHSSPPAPKIDFKRKKVIAVRAGPFNTGGYGIKLYSAIDTKNGVETVFLITVPEPDQIVTQAFTRPYIIICVTASQSTRISVTIEDKRF